MMLISSLILITLSSASKENCLRPKESECYYDDKYLLVTLPDIVSWQNADFYCLATYNTRLASIHSENDHADSERICTSLNSREVCWIGLHDTGTEGVFAWSDDTEHNVEFWGDWEPTSTFNGDTGEFEDCVHIASWLNNRWNDLDCSGDSNNIAIKAFLCLNPDFDVHKACTCNCDVCEVYGDPHFDTFDGLKHHYQGLCAYDYVTACDGDHTRVPFEVVGVHKPCLHNQACMDDINVKLYGDDGALLQDIVLAKNNKALYRDDSLVPLNQVTKYNPQNENAYFYAEVIGGDILQLSVFTARHWIGEPFADLIVRVTDLDGAYGYATIHITECWMGEVCGLCGKYDHNTDNDFMLPLLSSTTATITINDNDDEGVDSNAQSTQTQTTVSTKGVESAHEMDDDAWSRTNLFGDAWIVDTDAASLQSGSCSPDIYVAGDCLASNTTKTLCLTAYEQDCDACKAGDESVFVPIFDACLYDACAACTIDKMTKECVQPLTIYCDKKCEPKTSSPTSSPTAWPTQKPTPKPTSPPTKKPTSAPTEKPSQSPSWSPTAFPSPAPSAAPSWSPTQTPVVSPTWSPTPSPTQQPTKTPSAWPTAKPTGSPTYASCQWEFEVDIIFIIDTGCGLDSTQQRYQQQFLVNLIQTIKRTPNPKIGVIECNAFEILMPLSLADLDYNDIGADSLSDDKLLSLYRTLSNRREYVPGDATPKKECLQRAVQEFDENDDDGHFRERKVVMIAACADGDDDGADGADGSACALRDSIHDGGSQDMDVILVNVFDDTEAATSLDCLLSNDDLSKKFTYTDFAELETNSNQLYAIRAEICEKPTDDPTVSPTPQPTDFPTVLPTPSPLYKSCSWEYAADVVFVVDTSCGINHDEQLLQQAYVSDLMQLIKKNANPRVAIVECSHAYVHSVDMVKLALDDAVVNSAVEDPSFDDMHDLYMKILHKGSYVDGTSTPKTRCLATALAQFDDDDGGGGDSSVRQKKVVMVSNCAAEHGDVGVLVADSAEGEGTTAAVEEKDASVCSMKDAFASVEGDDDVEVIVINVGTDTKYWSGMADTAFVCLTHNERLFVYPDFESLSKESWLKGVRDEICEMPTRAPTVSPTPAPTSVPTENPTPAPTDTPTQKPTHSPSAKPSRTPSEWPTPAPTEVPTKTPTKNPTPGPTRKPSRAPTDAPTGIPTIAPTPSPTDIPTGKPTKKPTKKPTLKPSPAPTGQPSPSPTAWPTPSPTSKPSRPPTRAPTLSPSFSPTGLPTPAPTAWPTAAPSTAPTFSACDTDFEFNLVFAVDRSCELEQNECMAQNEFISEFFERIKSDYRPRISYVEYGYMARTVFNFSSHLNDDMSEFVSHIRGMQCDVLVDDDADESSEPIETNPLSALGTAIDLFDSYKYEGEPRENYLVMLNNCDAQSPENVCRFVPELKLRDIDVILVNAHNVECIEYNCLVRSPAHERVFCVDNLRRSEFLEIMDDIEREICTKPTEAPTMTPTAAPTGAPSFEPTAMPTMKVWQKRPWYPIKWSRSSSSSSSSSSESSSSSSHWSKLRLYVENQPCDHEPCDKDPCDHPCDKDPCDDPCADPCDPHKIGS